MMPDTATGDSSNVEECRKDSKSCVIAFNDIVLEPYKYLAKNVGKELRSELINAFDHWLHVPPTPMKTIAEVIRMLHNASLIIDDIEDGSLLRRGQPAAHCVFGTPSSINSANYVYFLALEKLRDLEQPDAIRIFTEQMLELHLGQGMDIFWRCSFRCPSEEEYRSMVIRKTGGLFGLAVRLMQLFSDNHQDYKELLDTLGLLFQIRDDYAILVDTSYHKCKTYAEDLTEGKFSFPIVRSIQAHKGDTQVMNILFQRTNDNTLKRHCVRHMAELGDLDYTVDTMAALEQRCYTLIEQFGGNPVLTAFVKKLCSIFRTDGGQLRRHTPSDFDFELTHSQSFDNDPFQPNGLVKHTSTL